MSKAELANEIIRTGQQFRYSNQNSLWIQAFQMYNANHTSKKKMDCSVCFAQVLQWLQS